MEQAFRLERLVMRGDVDAAYLETIGVSSPDIVVSELEGNLRALLRDMVCGHLQLDLHGLADELLRVQPQARPAAADEHRRRRAPEPEAPPEPDSSCAGATTATSEPDTEEAGGR